MDRNIAANRNVNKYIYNPNNPFKSFTYFYISIRLADFCYYLFSSNILLAIKSFWFSRSCPRHKHFLPYLFKRQRF